MKRLTLIAILAAAFFNVFGQVEIGIKGGLNVSTIKTKDIPLNATIDFNHTIGFHLGLSAQFDLSEKFHLNADLLFSSRGFEIENSKTTLNYVEIPVLLSYNLLDKLEFELGPNLGIKISEKSDMPGISYESLDIGLSTGLKFGLTDELFMSGRYYHGLTSIATLYASASDGESKSFNRTMQISLTYKIK